MTRKHGNLYRLLDGVTVWTDDLRTDVEDWLENYCTRDQLVKIIDQAGYHRLAPASNPKPTKAVLVLDIVENIPPTEHIYLT